MSKTKTATKKTPASKAKSAKAPAKKAKAAPPTATKVTGECAKGGEHEWTEEEGERFCAKCKEPAPKAAKAKRATKVAAETKAKPKKKAAEPKVKKVSAIDAAAQLLASAKEPMGCKDLIEAMSAKGLWSSPGGKTPHATLYSAILREISIKGKEARFVKTDRGRFAANA